MRRHRLVSFAPVLFMLGGCTLILGYGEEVELHAVVAEEAGPPPPSADASDGAPPPADAEAGPPPDARPFCETLSPKPTFCASFDGPSLLSEWTDSEATNASLSRDTSAFTSPPASLRVALDRAGGGPVRGTVGRDFPAWADKPCSVTIRFDVQIEAAAPTGTTAVIATPLVLLGEPFPSYLVQLVGRPLADGVTIGFGLVEVDNASSTSREHPSSVALLVGEWADVELTVTLGEAASEARLTIDGALGFEGSLGLRVGGTPATSFGMATVMGEASAWAYRLDDVTLDFR